MPVAYRLLSLFVFSLTAGVLLFPLLSGDKSPDQHSIDLALVEELLRNSEPTSSYRLIPESILTGLCWNTGDGSREGIFKDVNAGTSQWRNQAPVVARVSKAASLEASKVDEMLDYEQLSDELDHLSFEAIDYSFTEKSAEITGILETSGNKRRLVLKMTIPDTRLRIAQQDLIELSATAELDPADITHIASASAGQHLNLCIKMQAVRESVLPVPSADKPLMLSHYYH